MSSLMSVLFIDGAINSQGDDMSKWHAFRNSDVVIFAKIGKKLPWTVGSRIKYNVWRNKWSKKGTIRWDKWFKFK